MRIVSHRDKLARLVWAEYDQCCVEIPHFFGFTYLRLNRREVNFGPVKGTLAFNIRCLLISQLYRIKSAPARVYLVIQRYRNTYKDRRFQKYIERNFGDNHNVQ